MKQFSAPVAVPFRWYKIEFRTGCGFSRLLKFCYLVLVLVACVVLYVLFGNENMECTKLHYSTCSRLNDTYPKTEGTGGRNANEIKSAQMKSDTIPCCTYNKRSSLGYFEHPTQAWSAVVRFEDPSPPRAPNLSLAGVMLHSHPGPHVTFPRPW